MSTSIVYIRRPYYWSSNSYLYTITLRDRLVGNLPSVTLSAFAVQVERFVVLLYFLLDLLNGFKVFDSLDAQLVCCILIRYN